MKAEREVEQINFAFLVLKTMRFYGWSWQQTMNTPTSAFWTCYGYVERLRADESMGRLSEHSFAWMDEAAKKEHIQRLQDQIGNVVVETPVFDRDGWRTLQNLSHK